MGDKSTFQFVSVGQAGQPKNANDRKTVRKAAMLAFRRRERIERVKAFAAECAAEAEAKAPASPASLPDSIKPPMTTGDLIESGSVVLRTNPNLGTGSGTWLEELPAPTSISLIPGGLGDPAGFSFGLTPDTAYIFDYCTFSVMSPTHSRHSLPNITEAG